MTLYTDGSQEVRFGYVGLCKPRPASNGPHGLDIGLYLAQQI
jgi:hypothetical protein